MLIKINRRSRSKITFSIFIIILIILWRIDSRSGPPDEVANDINSEEQDLDCSFIYIVAGRHRDYELAHLSSWMKSGCSIEIKTPNVFTNLTEKEVKIIELLSTSAHPVVLADYLKLLSLYYSQTKYSVVFDFDVRLLKLFPSKWLAQGLEGCSVFFSIENSCYDEKCAEQYDGRTAQITTWIEVALQRNSVILRDLIDFISDRLLKLDQSTEGLSGLRTQEYSGSGPITMYLKQELNLDYISMPLSSSNVSMPSRTLKESPGSILKIPYKDEVICIGGQATAGNACSYDYPTPSSCLVKHYFEGSWKTKDPSFLSKITSFLFGNFS